MVNIMCPSHRRLLIWATVGATLFAGAYVALPIIAGAFEIGDRLGPRIYPPGLHDALCRIGWEMTDHQAVKPRIPFHHGSKVRPWFYGLDASTSSSFASQVLIENGGTYLLDPGGYKLVISLEPDGGGHLVVYELHEPVAGAVVASGDAGSNASRWFFYWSVDRELWVHSSDVGTFVWQWQSDAGYQRRMVADNATIRRMPDAVFDALPKSLKKEWSKKRSPNP